jgi:pimeloyl-ACP methyl ester carboxylesterase
MGGMIAQTVAIRHPERVLSLVSLMSNTGARFSGQPALAIYPVLLKVAPREREAFAEHVAQTYDKIGSPGFDRDLDEIRDLARRSHDRDRDPAAAGRQLAAIIASPDRGKDLGRIKAPTLVIHGKADKLVRPSGGRATARKIPGARLLEIEGMGHDLPRGAWTRIIEAIVDNARRAGFGVTARTAA